MCEKLKLMGDIYHQFNKIIQLFYSILFYSVWLFIHCSYIKELRQNSNIFPTESLILIFSNIEKIFRFQQKFLDGLRYGIEHNKIAETFLEFVSLTFFFVLVRLVFVSLGKMLYARSEVIRERGNKM